MTQTPTPTELPEALRLGVTVERLKEVIHYEPSTGAFTWLSKRGVSIRPGDSAGTQSKNGYVYVTVDDRRYRAHRLAWFYVHGVWPAHEIDHINQVKNDNRISNLREATHFENSQNRPMQANNKSGYRGVAKRKGYERWVARINIKGQCKYLGEFDSPEQAHVAYQSAAKETHTHRAED